MSAAFSEGWYIKSDWQLNVLYVHGDFMFLAEVSNATYGVEKKKPSINVIHVLFYEDLFY